MLDLLIFVSLVAFPQKPKITPASKSVPSQKSVIPMARPDKSIRFNSSTLALLAAGAEEQGRVVALETTLDWRYLSKANLALRPTSPQGQKSLEAALRSAQGTLTLTKDGQARLEVTTPGKDPLRRATTLTDTKKLYAYRYDNDGKLAAVTERTFVLA